MNTHASMVGLDLVSQWFPHLLPGQYDPAGIVAVNRGASSCTQEQ